MPFVKVNKDTKTETGRGFVKVDPTDNIDRQELVRKLAGDPKPYVDPRTDVGGNVLDAAAGARILPFGYEGEQGVTPEQQIESASQFYQRGRPVQALMSEIGAGVQQAGKDVSTIPAHYFNQALMNAPRSTLETFSRYKFPEDTKNKGVGILAKTAGVLGIKENLGAKSAIKVGGAAVKLTAKAAGKLAKIGKVKKVITTGKKVIDKGRLILRAEKAAKLAQKAKDASLLVRKSKDALSLAKKAKNAASIASHTKAIASLTDKAHKANTAAKVASNAVANMGSPLLRVAGSVAGFGLKDSRVIARAAKGAGQGLAYGFAYSPEDFGNMKQRTVQATVGAITGGLIGLSVGTFKKLSNATTEKGRIRAAESVRTEISKRSEAAQTRLARKGIFSSPKRADKIVIERSFGKGQEKAKAQALHNLKVMQENGVLAKEIREELSVMADNKTALPEVKKQVSKRLKLYFNDLKHRPASVGGDGKTPRTFTSKEIGEIADDFITLYDTKVASSLVKVGKAIGNLKTGFGDPEQAARVNRLLPKDLLMDLKDIKDTSKIGGYLKSAAGPFIAGAATQGVLGKLARTLLP